MLNRAPTGCSGRGPVGCVGAGPLPVSVSGERSPGMRELVNLKSRRSMVLVAAGAVVVAVLTMLIAASLHSAAKPSAAAAAQRSVQRVKERGWTDRVTVPVYAANQAHPSMPRPAKLPPMIRSTGGCATAMDRVRDFQDAHPTGMTLNAADLKQVNTLMSALDPNLGGACTASLYRMFLLQEYQPWMLWQPPAAPVKATPARPAHRIGKAPTVLPTAHPTGHPAPAGTSSATPASTGTPAPSSTPSAK